MIKNKTALIIALKNELSDELLNNLNFKTINNFKCGYLKNKSQDVIFIFSGVGKANAACATQFAITTLGYKNIINIGSAGSKNKKLKYGDVCFISKAKYIDVDTTIFGYKKGQLPHESEVYQIKTKGIEKIYSIISDLNINIHKNVMLGSADSFVNKKTCKKFYITSDIQCVDMEGTSIAQVVNKFEHVNLLIIKVISDNAYSKKNEWTNNVKKINSIIKNVILNLIK